MWLSYFTKFKQAHICITVSHQFQEQGSVIARKDLLLKKLYHTPFPEITWRRIKKPYVWGFPHAYQRIIFVYFQPLCARTSHYTRTHTFFYEWRHVVICKNTKNSKKTWQRTHSMTLNWQLKVVASQSLNQVWSLPSFSASGLSFSILKPTKDAYLSYWGTSTRKSIARNVNWKVSFIEVQTVPKARQRQRFDVTANGFKYITDQKVLHFCLVRLFGV